MPHPAKSFKRYILAWFDVGHMLALFKEIFYVSLALGSTECILLAVMAFDRYAAVCKPLHYAAVMNPRLCQALAGVAWLSGVGNALTQSTVTLWLPRCGHQWLHHFFCEVPAVMKLSCSDTSLYETLMYLCCVLMLLIPVTIISSSYSFILLTIHRMNSAEGRKKALTTCSSHMTVVILFYGTITGVYLSPSPSHSADKDSLASVMYMVVTPTLNPFIYCLRNKDMQGALRKLVGVKVAFHGL